MTAKKDSPYSPRLLSCEDAAGYVGLSPPAFLVEVAAGNYPDPVPMLKVRRKLWDKVEIDRVLDRRLNVVSEDIDELERRWKANKGRPPAARRRVA